MSYILEALKKSEQERGAGNIPSVQTVHSSSLLYRKEKPVRWPYILIIAVLLNITIIGYFIYMQQSRSVAMVTQAHHTENVADHSATVTPVTTTTLATEQKKISSQPVTNTLTTAQFATANNRIIIKNRQKSLSKNNENSSSIQHIEKSTHTNVATQSSVKTVAAGKTTPPVIPATEAGNTDISTPVVIEEQDLPEAIKRELPSLTISSHVYSDNPQQRSMVINDRSFEEGDYVMDGLILYKITPDGAIFKYKDLLFHDGVVSTWQ